MKHISRPQLTVISGPVIEANGVERLYVGAYIPETVPSHEMIRVQECIGFLAVKDRDPNFYPRPRDGWVVRPTNADEETIEDVAKVIPGAKYEQQSHAIPLRGLEILVGREAIDPRTSNDTNKTTIAIESSPQE